MRVRILSSGKVVEAKFFKDLTEEELNNFRFARDMWDGYDTFLDYKDVYNSLTDGGYDGMVYIHESEFEFIEEEDYVV